MALGAFFAPQTVPELIELYFDTQQRPNIEKAFDILVQHGLLERSNATNNSITTYTLHDLAYSYAYAGNNEDSQDKALGVCLKYLRMLSLEEDVEETFPRLTPIISVIVGAVQFAYETNRAMEVIQLVEDFAAKPSRRGFLHLIGLYRVAVELHKLAYKIAEQNKMLDKHMEKYDLQDQDWRKQKPWYQPNK